MPPADKPPAADGADSQPRRARRVLPPTSEERQIMAGCIVLNIGAILILTVATFAVKSTLNILLVGGGAILAVLVLAFVLNRYAPSPKPQLVRRVEDEGPGWAIWQAVYVAINLAIVWHILDETNRQGWDIGHGIWLLVILVVIALAASNIMRWAKARQAGRDQGRTEL